MSIKLNHAVDATLSELLSQLQNLFALIEMPYSYAFKDMRLFARWPETSSTMKAEYRPLFHSSVSNILIQREMLCNCLS